jgi:hypothetical protein
LSSRYVCFMTPRVFSTGDVRVAIVARVICKTRCRARQRRNVGQPSHEPFSSGSRTSWSETPPSGRPPS